MNWVCLELRTSSARNFGLTVFVRWFFFFFWNVDLGFESKVCDFAHFNSPQVLHWITVWIESASTDLWCVLHDPIFNLLVIQIILQQRCYPPRVLCLPACFVWAIAQYRCSSVVGDLAPADSPASSAHV